MRLPRVRLSVRWMMIAVAAVGMLLGFGTWSRRRSEGFRERAVMHLLEWRSNDLGAASGTAGCPERAAYHAALLQKYGRAARTPSFPVEPDPPEPK